MKKKARESLKLRKTNGRANWDKPEVVSSAAETD
jgi:hypothetical protein